MEEIYQQIITDLIQAESLLSIEYVNNERVRPNRYAASALLARVYLYVQDYENAQLKASEVIEADSYQLEEDLNNTFLPQSREAIWQLYPTNTAYNSAEGFAFNPSSATARPAHAIYDGLKNSFTSYDRALNKIVGKQPFKQGIHLEKYLKPISKIL